MKYKSPRQWKVELFDGANHKPCCYCAEDMTLDQATLEHKVAKTNGGNWHHSNLALACVRCNGAKGALTLTEFLKTDYAKRRGLKNPFVSS